MSSLVKHLHPAWRRIASAMRGNGYVLRLMHLLSSRRSEIHLMPPSFFGIKKVGAPHSDSPVRRSTPIRTRRSSSCLVGDDPCTVPKRYLYSTAPETISRVSVCVCLSKPRKIPSTQKIHSSAFVTERLKKK